MHRSLRRHGLAMVMVAGLSGGVAGGALGALASERPAAVAGDTSTSRPTTTRPAQQFESSASKPSENTRPKRHDHAEKRKSANFEDGKKHDSSSHGGDHQGGKDGGEQ